MPAQRTPYLSPPRYNIDALLDVDLTPRGAANDAIQSLWAAIDDVPQSPDHDYFRPDSALLEPEIAVADICRFCTTMGNGFSVSLGYPGGILCFSRALRSLRLIEHPKALTLVESIRDLIAQHGFRTFTSFPDDPIYGWSDQWPEDSGYLDWETEQRVEQVTGHCGRNLDSRWWALDRGDWDNCSDPSLDNAVCEYLNCNRDLLRRRKPTAS